MLPGFSFLLGLGSLFVAAFKSTPRYQSLPSDFEKEEFRIQLRHWNAEIHGMQVPRDYLAAIAEEYNLPDQLNYVGFSNLAANKGTCIAEERQKYFEWRCRKEGVRYIPGVAWDYCSKVRAWTKPAPEHRKLLRQEEIQ